MFGVLIAKVTEDIEGLTRVMLVIVVMEVCYSDLPSLFESAEYSSLTFSIPDLGVGREARGENIFPGQRGGK